MISLTYNKENDKVLISQNFEPPTIYLDQCILRKISENHTYSKNFIELLSSKKGTLIMSATHLLESSSLKGESLKLLITFVRSISPRFYFIELDPPSVIRRENDVMMHKSDLEPQSDIALLKLYAELKRSTIDCLDPTPLFTNLDSPRMDKMRKEFLMQFSEKIRLKQIEFNKDTKSKESTKIRKVPKINQNIPATRYIYDDTFNSLIRDGINLTKNSNHFRDFTHSVVPLAYCDFVILDNSWADRMNKIIKRLVCNGLNTHVAKIFSERGLDNFWDHFSRFD